MQNYLTSDTIDEYFSNYKAFMFWIMLGFTIASTIIQFIINHELSKKI